MSNVHTYWSYGPEGGVPVIDALAEGRRAFALDLATRQDDTDDGHLARARKFEEYLKGLPVTDVNGAPLLRATDTEIAAAAREMFNRLHPDERIFLELLDNLSPREEG